MAVIQDLPAETLYRVLELGAEDETCFKARDLCSTALVARAWSQPSQHLLFHMWWSPHISRAPQYDTSPPPTRRLPFVTVYSPTTTAQIRRLFERHGTQLTHLDMHGSCETSDLMFLLVHGLEHLGLSGTVQGAFTFSNGGDLILRSLCLESSATCPATFLQVLVAHAPQLTRLELENRRGWAIVYQAPLLALAPQLRHLNLWFSISRPADSDPESCALLQSCTSLVSLDLELVRPGSLVTLLSSISSHLAILACYFDEDYSTDEGVSSDLHDALKQPALADLKRWRWLFRDFLRDGQQVPHSQEVVESWEVACRARGIEPRGEERYFTD